ncbi:MAG: chromosomal replication initiator protein DnaA [Oscillospiraceae bacterium]|nr:chromosomal replication initiator protein DnaA [Oscillospiraceae bacterium]
MYSADHIWAKVLEHLELLLGDVLVQTWFDDTKAIDLTETQLILYVPTDFRQQVIEKHYIEHIRQALRQLGQTVEPVLRSDPGDKPHWDKDPQRPSFPSCPQFTLDNYIAGSSNQVALKVATAVAHEPGQSIYDPLFFYGPPGVGKTHLLYAIANEICARQPQLQVVYVKCEQFTHELVEAIRDRNTTAFREKYRTADVLLMDDIQFIAGKEATQEEFFHTFNELHEHHRQIVLAADRRPGDMTTLEERLKSRFGEGIMVGIVPPDRETRLLILRSKAAALGLHFSEEVLELLASRLTDNVRQIEGALKKIRALRDLDDMALTKENVEKAIEDLCMEAPTLTICADRIIDTVSRYYGLDRTQLLGPQRNMVVAEARQISMYLARTAAGLPLPKIGQTFGRHHATVLHGIEKIQDLLQSKDPRLCKIMEELSKQLQE